MSTSLITGGAGFIGSHIADTLIEKGHRLIILDNLSIGNKTNIHPEAKFYEADIQDTRISNIFKKEKPDFIFHLAAQIDPRNSVNNPIFDSKVNILGAINVLENSEKYKVKKVIFTSSCAVYGQTDKMPVSEIFSTNPLSPYGINKLAIEKYLQYYRSIKRLNYITLRLSNVYGPRQNNQGESGVVAIFINKIFRGKQSVIFGDGKQTRDYIYVKDVVRALIMAQENAICGEFNISTGKETSVLEILAKISKKLKSSTGHTHASFKNEVKRSCLDFQKAKNKLGWSPMYNLDKGIDETVNWFLANK